MRVFTISGVRSVLQRLQGARGVRAGLAVGVGMLACHLLGRPSGWVAIGGLYVNLVDNGGPFQSRLANILTLLTGGSLAVLIGVMAGGSLAVNVAVTFAFCFIATLCRAFSQPLAATGVLILICYVIAVGGVTHTAAFALSAALYFTLGSMWAALLTLVLWPRDPFRPARLAVADVYAALTRLVELLPSALEVGGRDPVRTVEFNGAIARLRLQLEVAQQAVAETPARMTARTVRARNLTVITESADLLLARLLRLSELSGTGTAASSAESSAASAAAVQTRMQGIVAWLSSGLGPVEPALRNEPFNRGVAFTREGSLWVDLHRGLEPLVTSLREEQDGRHIVAVLDETLFTVETIYEAVRAIWTGYESRNRTRNVPSAIPAAAAKSPFFFSSPMFSSGMLDTLQANFTLRSILFRHALRLAAVVALDEVITRFVHVLGAPGNHGYWLAMTSLIVLQPYTGETVRKSGQRVAGTVAGALLAAALAAAVPGTYTLIAIISLGAVASVAVYAVDYAWYSFFLTPTIVLMTLPHLHDWRFAAVRMGMTVLGAVVAVLAMLLLWPERESLQLPRLLGRGAAAEATYLRATLRFWESLAGGDLKRRLEAERTLLAPARRLCGLAANEAEETLDHALLEHALPLNPARDRTAQLNAAALTFTTYLRRLTQTVTTLAAIGQATAESGALLRGFAERLETMGHALEQHAVFVPEQREARELADEGVPVETVRRIERQVTVLERTAAELCRAEG